jgi:hypothetical protein
MKKRIIPILMLIEFVSQAETPKYLTLHSEGNTTSYAISNICKITFGKQTANIYQKGNTKIDSYAYSILTKGVFEVEPSGVEGVLVDNKDLSITYNVGLQEIIVSSSQEITTIEVCNLNGMVVEMSSPMTPETVVSLADCASGMYVVKAVTATATQTQKIVKH